jgi:hypothetical protein
MFQMLRDKNLIRHLAACETMGNATTICSDKVQRNHHHHHRHRRHRIIIVIIAGIMTPDEVSPSRLPGRSSLSITRPIKYQDR